ncbi:MAG: acyl-CoA dehydrogenase family protein [Alphaproteobacteria bacterium]
MDFELSEDQLAFQKTAADFAADQLAPHAARWDKEEIFAVDAMREAAKLGFAGIYVSEEMGGTGLGRLDAAIIFEALSAGCVSTASFLSIHNMAAWMIDRFGNAEQRKTFLPPLMGMDWIASYCLTEPASGSDAAALRTRASRDGDHYVLNGAKQFISGAGTSDLYVTMVRTGEDGPGGISCLVIPKDSPGISFGKLEQKMGWRSQPTGQVIFENCRVPVANRLGAEGDGFKIAMQGLDGGRINIGACSLGPAGAALKLSQDYMKERQAFGKPLAAFQGLQFKVADMATEFEAAQLLIYRAAQSLDARLPNTTMKCAMAKRFATDVGFRVVNDALQIHGGYGYTEDYPFERWVRDLRVHQILEGTNEIMRVIIARDMFRQ